MTTGVVWLRVSAEAKQRAWEVEWVSVPVWVWAWVPVWVWARVPVWVWVGMGQQACVSAKAAERQREVRWRTTPR